MMKLKSRYRYPIFFAGFFIMEIAGFLFRYMKVSLHATEALVALGFALFLASLLLP